MKIIVPVHPIILRLFIWGMVIQLPLHAQGQPTGRVNDSAYVLPSTIKNLKAYQLNGGLQVIWVAHDEINMKSYDVEHSTDGKYFNKIGTVAAKNNGALQNNYSLFDGSPVLGANYYRIKTIERNDTARYSNVAQVFYNNIAKNILVYPNPVTNKTLELQLTGAGAGNYMLAIYNVAGQKIYAHSYAVAGSNALITTALKNVPAGIYQLQITNTSVKYLTTLVVH